VSIEAARKGLDRGLGIKHASRGGFRKKRNELVGRQQETSRTKLLDGKDVGPESWLRGNVKKVPLHQVDAVKKNRLPHAFQKRPEGGRGSGNNAKRSGREKRQSIGGLTRKHGRGGFDLLQKVKGVGTSPK